MNRSSRILNPLLSRRGFTIVEMIVTIGVLVVVTAGVATIFGSVGDTVSKGRKLSELNQFAARLERVMREDFDAMTRDGFLVIVNKNANFGNDVELFRGEQTNIDRDLYSGFSSNEGRIRRSDEIMFFSRGDYETSRRAISSDMIARSSEAAIYYGHGQKRRPQTSSSDPRYDDPANFFFNPQPWDNNFDDRLDTRLGINTPGLVNPNEFARDWSLLRHVTLLVNPHGVGQSVPREIFGIERTVLNERIFLEDSPRQYALQPAARSIFTSLSGSDPMERHRWLHDLGILGSMSAVVPPHYRVSGLVDIVSEDLATIRGMIQSLPVTVSPDDYFNYNPSVPQPRGFDPVRVDRDLFEERYWGTSATGPNPTDALSINLGKPTMNGGWNPGNAGHVTRIRKWMIDALPSRWNLNFNNPSFVSGVRYEDIPTRILFEDSDFTQGNDQDDNRRAYAEANQEMLGSSVFVPRCSEFVVEWSYGFVNNAITDPLNPDFKELIWYGLDRFVDSNNDGLLSSDGSDQLAGRLYRARTPAQAGTDPSFVPAKPRFQGVDPELIVGRPNQNFSSPNDIEIATFGFSTKSNEPEAVWLWPKLIRVTMNLADPSDREIERTYQVIFELPELD
jgi:prepilin-type N-terminal cleavage/methylation domain-containing protein